MRSEWEVISTKSSHAGTEIKLLNGDKVVKIQTLEEEGQFYDEVKFQTIAAEHGIAPVIYDNWCDNGKGYIVMDLMNTGNYTEETFKDQSKGLVEKLIKLHKLGIAHCDLRDCNIMNKDDEMFIIDYGISCEATQFLKVYDTVLLSAKFFEAEPPDELVEYMKILFDELIASGGLKNENCSYVEEYSEFEDDYVRMVSFIYELLPDGYFSNKYGIDDGEEAFHRFMITSC